MGNVRVFLSLTEKEAQKLDRLRADYGMTRSQYISYVLSKKRRAIPRSVRLKELIDVLSEINLSLRMIALKEEISDEDRLLVFDKIRQIQDALNGF